MAEHVRKNCTVRVIRMDDPDQELRPEYAQLTPGQRIELCMRASIEMWKTTHGNRPLSPRLPRHAWVVEIGTP